MVTPVGPSTVSAAVPGTAGTMALVNVNTLLSGKDSRWLQLEVCREFQRNKCSRPDTECKFAHPANNVEVQNGRVTACYDSIKGRCNRDKPPCKYFHPPQHLKDQLLINGRNHLALKNAILQQMGLSPGQTTVIQSQIPTVTNPYLPAIPQVGSTFSPYLNAATNPLMPTAATALLGPDPTNPLSIAVQQSVVTQQKMPRTDRLEPTTPAGIAATLTTDITGRKRPHDSNDDLVMAFPGMLPYKRAVGEKSGIPVYQQSAAAAAAYQQLLQPFVPVSCEYRLPTSSTAFPTTVASAAAALTGIALNKPPVPSVSSRFPQTVLSPALTQHFLPTFTAIRTNPQIPTVAFPHTTNISDYLVAQFANFTNSGSSVVNSNTSASAGSNSTSSTNNNNEEDVQPFKKMKTN